MTIEVNIKENKLQITFEEDAPFDAAILEKIQDSFIKLNPKDFVYVDVVGSIPIEVLGYLNEVSNYCNLTISVFDDEKGFEFLKHLKQSTSANIKLEYKGKNNGS